MSRTPFNKLSSSYRNRLVYREAGGKRLYDSMTVVERREVRKAAASTHRSGDLIRARGHQPARPAGAVPDAVIDTILAGQGRPVDLKTLASKFTRPAWVPQSAAVDVAAALSRFPDPSRWTGVEFTPRGEGQPWTMTVHMKGNAYDRVFDIPGGGGPGSGAKEVLAIVANISDNLTPTGRRRTVSSPYDVFYEVLGSDEEAE